MSDCLGTDTLVELVEGRADATARARIEKHASNCEHCRALLSSLARGDDDEDPDLATTKRDAAHDDTMPSAPPAKGSGSDEAADDTLAADVKVGRYIIQSAIGAGGMGVVYAARDPELDRIVAVKVLRGDGSPTMQERLRREAKAMAQLAHPNVVAVFDVGKIGERIFVAMEYIEGETLARWLKTPRVQRQILDAYRAAGFGLAVAHAAGIVHRDFKPENVLVGKDGRVRVVDFGLARTSDATDSRLAQGSGIRQTEPIAGDGPTLAAGLTQTGTMLGTPYYMAPEVYAGAQGDARSDQFSFCVGLFTALYGERPFDGDTLDALAVKMQAGKVVEPAAASKVPKRIRAAIRRGLSVDPAARFSSIDQLLAELEAPGRRAMRVVLPAAVAVLAGGGFVAYGLARTPETLDQRCTGAAAAFAPVWNPEARAAIDKAFSTSKLPFALATVHEVTAALDRYAADWIDAHTDACKATQIRGEQTDATMDRRMVCLARRKQEVAALVDQLGHADDAAVGRAATAADSLPDLRACADVAALSQVVAPPSDPALRSKIDDLTPRLARARAKYQMGKLPAALDDATKIADQVRPLGYRPLEAEADLLQGQVERAMGDPHAKASLEAAVWAAEAGRHDEVAARAWANLTFIVGYGDANYAKGAELAQRASAAIARLGGNADIESALEQSLGAMAADQNHVDEAIGHFEKAVALAEKFYGQDHPMVAAALDNLGQANMAQGHPDRDIEIQKRALDIRVAKLGDGHPAVAQSFHNLCNGHEMMGAYAVAEDECRKALDIRRKVLPAQHPDIAANLSDLARTIRKQHRLADALVFDREAVDIGEKAFGPDNPAYAEQLVNLAVNLGQLAKYDESDAMLAKAEAIYTKLHGATHATVMHARAARGDNQLRQHHWQKAASIYEPILPLLDHSEGELDTLASTRSNLAIAYLELHQAKRALAMIEAAEAMPHGATSPENLGEIHFTHARALWDTGGDKAAAKQLATKAQTELANNPTELAEVTAWLASR